MSDFKGGTMTDPLSNLKFKESSGEGTSEFIKFKAGEAVKLRVFTTNPTIHINNYGKEQISFAVWNYNEDKAMILSKGPSIARQISHIHQDEDFGADITKLDIKIMATGEGMEREYNINPLPKSLDVSDAQLKALEELDKKLSTIFKGSVRAEEYNNGVEPRAFVKEEQEEEIDLEQIPF